MDKIIVVNGHQATIKRSEFKELEYPELNKYLEKGFAINKILPVVQQNHSSTLYYSIIFHLKS